MEAECSLLSGRLKDPDFLWALVFLLAKKLLLVVFVARRRVSGAIGLHNTPALFKPINSSRHKMPKAPAFTPKPALEKIGLAVRKDIRDKYESEKEELEATISQLLGVTFHVEINANEVLPYNPANSNASVGAMFKRYVDGFITALKGYLDKFGDEGKTHFNDAVTKSELTLNVNELGDKVKT
ncbi:hypothetical protein H0H93_013364 [Arthromyces matolae]|nr:hypothetical protein H0H93_013364 [Arthromyces matolae]